MFIVGIAGGTGSGKTTLGIGLYKKDSAHRALLHLDDYFNKAKDIPSLHGFTNYEDPIALKFDELFKDISTLINGEDIVVRTKSELFNPDYNHTNPNKIAITIKPASILIIEGYLLLHDAKIRDLIDLKIFLQTDLSVSSKRRSATKDPIDQKYFDLVLQPMFEKYVEPTKKFADVVVDASNKTPEEILAIVETKI